MRVTSPRPQPMGRNLTLRCAFLWRIGMCVRTRSKAATVIHLTYTKLSFGDFDSAPPL